MEQNAFLYATKPKDVWSLSAGPSPNIVSVVLKASAGSTGGGGEEQGGHDIKKLFTFGGVRFPNTRTRKP